MVQGLQSVDILSIGRKIEIAQTQGLSDRDKVCNFLYRSASSSTNNYRGQHTLLYYQPQPSADYNQRQQYCHYKTTQQYPYRTDYEKNKKDKCCVTKSGIPSSDIK